MKTPGKATSIAELRGPINGLIVDYMRRNNIPTLRAFADHVGVSRQTIYNLVRGRSTANGTWTKPGLDTLAQLASALGRPTHELLYLIDPSAPGSATPLASQVTQVPVAIAGSVGAGPEQMYELDGYTYVEKEFATGRDLIAFKVAGDSMAGGRRPIYKDDLVIVDRHIAGEINSAVVARLKGDGYVCKRLRTGNYLDSANPDFSDPEAAIIPPDQVAEIVGKVVRIVSNL